MIFAMVFRTGPAGAESVLGDRCEGTDRPMGGRLRRVRPGGFQPSFTAVPEALTINMLVPTVS